MPPEVHDPDGFYASATGIVAKRLLRTRLRASWPELAGCDVLGLGHAGPFLRLWRRRARRLVSAVPAHAVSTGAAGAARPRPWPPDGPGALVLVDEERLPFSDLSFDAVLMVHGLEVAEHQRRLLREVWRVLRDDGRLLVVVPNRRSVWAHLERTPFAQGSPFSRGQISRLLRRAMFAVEGRSGALWVPPFRTRALLRGAAAWERVGRLLAPNLAGVVVVEASKAMFGAVPAGAVPAGRRVVLAEGGAAARRGAVPRTMSRTMGRARRGPAAP